MQRYAAMQGSLVQYQRHLHGGDRSRLGEGEDFLSKRYLIPYYSITLHSHVTILQCEYIATSICVLLYYLWPFCHIGILRFYYITLLLYCYVCLLCLILLGRGRGRDQGRVIHLEAPAQDTHHLLSKITYQPDILKTALLKEDISSW